MAEMISEEKTTCQETRQRYSLLLCLTGAIWLSFFTLGLAYNITGPVLLDLAEVVNTTVSVVSWVLPTRGFGIGLGSIFRGHVIDTSRCRVVACVATYVSFGGLTAAIPWCTSLWAMILVFFIQGLFIGFIETDGNDLCIQTWGEKHAPYLMAVYSGFTAGSLIAPIIVMPFIKESPRAGGLLNQGPDDVIVAKLSTHNLTRNVPEITSTNLTITGPVEPISLAERMRLDNLHFIVMGVCLFVGVILSSFTYMTRFSIRVHEDVEGKSAVEEEPKINRKWVRYFFVALLSIYVFNTIGSELTYSSLLTVFVVKQLGLTKSLGTQMTTLYWVLGFVWAVAFIPISRYIKGNLMILGLLVLISLSTLVLSIFSSHSEVATWVVTVGLGSATGVSYACVFIWADQYLCLTVQVSSILVAFSTFGEMAYPAITGPFLDTRPMVLAYALVGGMICNIAIYVTVESMRRNVSLSQVDALSSKIHENGTMTYTTESYPAKAPMEGNGHIDSPVDQP